MRVELRETEEQAATNLMEEQKELLAQTIDKSLHPLHGWVDEAIGGVTEGWGQLLLWLRIAAGGLAAILILPFLLWALRKALQCKRGQDTDRNQVKDWECYRLIFLKFRWK